MARKAGAGVASTWETAKRLNFFPGFNDLPMPHSSSEMTRMFDESHATNIAHVVYMLLLPIALVYSVLTAPAQVAFSCQRPYSELSAADFPHDLRTVTLVMQRALERGISSWNFVAWEPPANHDVRWDYPDVVLKTTNGCPNVSPCHVFNVTNIRIVCDLHSGMCGMIPLNQGRPVLSGAVSYNVAGAVG